MVCLKKAAGRRGGNGSEIKELTRWLQEATGEMAATESTGAYWKPLYNLEPMGLEATVNAAPRQKTGVKAVE